MKNLMTSSLVIVALAALPVIVNAQDVRDFTGHQPTEQELIDTLKPKQDTHRTRGIGMAPAAAPAPIPGAPPAPAAKPCQAIAVARSRGIAPVAAPVSDSVAMKVEFPSNSADLTPDAKKSLDALGKALTSSDLSAFCFVVEGHTDGVGSDGLNLKLSERRAQSVVHYLAEHFKIDEGRLQAVGYGKRKPIADNDTEEGRQKNRRVQVANVGT